MTTKTAAKTYADAIDFVLDHEGRIVENVPGDPGGKTKWGITQADYAAFRREHGLPKLDVFQATPAEIETIYREHYADPVHFDDLPYSLGLTLLDTAVNLGTGRAVSYLQGVVGVVVDGAFGPNTLAATTAYIDAHGPVMLAIGIITRRDTFYRSIGAPGRRLSKFLKGWLQRTTDLRKEIGA